MLPFNSSEKSSESFASKLQTGSELLRWIDEEKSVPLLSTGVEALDRVQGGGLRPGSVVELFGRRSSGRMALGLAAIASVTESGQAAALIDLGDQLDPHSAAEAGIDLQRLLWLRPRKVENALSGAEMILDAGFPLVVLDLGVRRLALGRIPAASWLRLARAARRHKGILLLLSPFHICGPAASVVELAAARPLWLGRASCPLLGAIGSSLRASLWKGQRPSFIGIGGAGAAEPATGFSAPLSLPVHDRIRGRK